MNELENQLAELVKKGIEVAESTGNFVIDQAPQLLQEFYRWHIMSNAMGMIISGLLVYLSFKFFIFCGRKEEESSHDTKILKRYYKTAEIPFMLLSMITGVLIVIMTICFINDLFDLVKLIVAPKIYLIEYFIK